jgi:hypothetical protein
MTRFIRGLALSMLVGMSVAGLALAQMPGGPQTREAEEALEEAREAEETPEAEEALEALEALAVPRTGYFDVYPYASGIHCFYWEDLIEMSEYDAHGYVNNGAVLRVAMWGDDPLYDDLLLGPFVARRGTFDPRISATPQGIQVLWFGCTDTEVLDEDIGGDELFVEAVVFNGDGGLLRAFESPRVHGNY